MSKRSLCVDLGIIVASKIKNVGNLLRSDEWKRELGTNSDGSMGAYGGKKY